MLAITDEIKTMRRCSAFLSNTAKFAADTLYLGGGTPSVLTGEDIERIVNCAKEKFKLPKNSEITIECNPSSPIEDLIPYFKQCGINRISLGMQSAVNSERRILGRTSDKKRVKEVTELLQSNGFNNISLDIMLGIPEQTKESLKETLDFVLSCNVQHISAYILKIEEGTFFDKHKDRYNFLDDDEAACLYEFCSKYLKSNGFNHYEISNFAKKGFESKHNTKYWKSENYLGIGAAAHSFVDGKRFYFAADTQAFINADKAIFDSYGGDVEEYIMLRLRLKEGLDLNELLKLYPEFDTSALKKKIPLFVNKKLADYKNNTLSLTTKGMLLSNYIIGEII